MGPWVQGLFGTQSSFTPIMAEQKCVCGHVWGDPGPHKLPRPLGRWSFYGSQDPVLPVP